MCALFLSRYEAALLYVVVVEDLFMACLLYGEVVYWGFANVRVLEMGNLEVWRLSTGWNS